MEVSGRYLVKFRPSWGGFDQYNGLVLEQWWFGGKRGVKGIYCGVFRVKEVVE